MEAKLNSSYLTREKHQVYFSFRNSKNKNIKLPSIIVEILPKCYSIIFYLDFVWKVFVE